MTISGAQSQARSWGLQTGRVGTWNFILFFLFLGVGVTVSLRDSNNQVMNAVESFDVIEDGRPGSLPAEKAMPVEKLALQTRHETL
jgi:hypothetical protein